jgi:hypothetical protein
MGHQSTVQSIPPASAAAIVKRQTARFTYWARDAATLKIRGSSGPGTSTVALEDGSGSVMEKKSGSAMKRRG